MSLTPQLRLAASRRAIVQSMNRDRDEQESDDMPESSTSREVHHLPP